MAEQMPNGSSMQNPRQVGYVQPGLHADPAGNGSLMPSPTLSSRSDDASTLDDPTAAANNENAGARPPAYAPQPGFVIDYGPDPRLPYYEETARLYLNRLREIFNSRVGDGAVYCLPFETLSHMQRDRRLLMEERAHFDWVGNFNTAIIQQIDATIDNIGGGIGLINDAWMAGIHHQPWDF